MACNSGDAYIREYIMGSKDEVTGEFLGGKAILKAVVVGLLMQKPYICIKRPVIYSQKKRYASEKQGPVFMGVAEHVGYLKKENRNSRSRRKWIWCLLRTFIPMGFEVNTDIFKILSEKN